MQETVQKIKEKMICDDIKVEIRDKVAIVSLDHPKVNAISVDMLRDLRLIFEMLPEDKDVRCIILNSIGKHFSGGADFTTFKVLPRGANTPYGLAVYGVIEDCPIPVIASIHGACLGGGMELTLACDIRVAAESSYMGLVEANLGIAPNYGGCTRLAWLIGEGNAKYLMFTADKITAEKAKEYGILLDVYPDDQLFEKTLELANHFAEKAPLSARANKRVIHNSRRHIMGVGFIEEDWASRFLNDSEDAKEGFKALAEKRKPVFKGK